MVITKRTIRLWILVNWLLLIAAVALSLQDHPYWRALRLTLQYALVLLYVVSSLGQVFASMRIKRQD